MRDEKIDRFRKDYWPVAAAVYGLEVFAYAFLVALVVAVGFKVGVAFGWITIPALIAAALRTTPRHAGYWMRKIRN